MAKVKVLLEKGETQSDADEALLKALNHHASGDAHMTESFDDPAMIDATYIMKAEYEKIYTEMIQEISDELDKEFL